MPLRVALSGQVGIETGGSFRDTAGLGRLGRLAFAYLVSERHRPVTRDELAEVLWGEDLPRTWDTSLRVVVSKMRTWLVTAGLKRDEALVSGFGCYQINLPAGTVVDVEKAAADLDAARRALAAGDLVAARAAAMAAAEATAQDFLPGAAGAWVEQQQGHLRDLRLDALETLADAATAAGDRPTALAAAEEAVALEPLRESAHLRAVAAHAAAGNRGEALRAYEGLRRLLAEELGVPPSARTEAAYLALLRDEPPAGDIEPAAGAPLAAAPAAVHALPLHPVGVRLPYPESTFVGREAEVAQVAALLRSSRLVSLVGTGGLGKTRLALEAARALAPEFAGGTAFASLGELPEGSDGAAVAAIVAAALGMVVDPGRPVLESLGEALADRRLLLVLDNCEHVVAGAAEVVAWLLRAGAGLVALATTREPLRVGGEVAWRVPPLAPEDARRLLVERSAAAAGEAPEADAAVDLVCERLDRIPLAIELAAARTDVLSLPEIAARLDDRFGLLTTGARTAPARHRTLRAAIDWSYESLAEPERSLLRGVAVFAGSFTLDGAASVTGRADVLEGLAALVARSLVASERAGSVTRYRLLETIRAYAGERLGAAGEAPALQTRLVAWAARLAEEAEMHLDGPDQEAWLNCLDAEHANLRAALAVAPAGTDALRLAAALGRFWEVRGHLHEGREWLRVVLAQAEGAPPALRARAHNAAALLAQRQGDYAAARSRLEESLAIRQRAGDRLGTAVALHGLGNVAALQHDLTTARDLYEKSLAIGREEGDLALVAAALDNLGWVAHVGADFAAARLAYEDALAVRREMGDTHGTALVLGHLGDLAYQQGDYDRAAALHGDSLRLHTAVGDRSGRADSLATLGHVALHEGDVAGARAQLEEALALRLELGDRAALPGALTSLADVAVVAGDLAEARSRLDEALGIARAGREGVGAAHVQVHRARVARLAGDPEDALREYAQARGAAADQSAGALTAEWLEGVGATLATGGPAEDGARLLGAADALRAAIGAPVPPHERPGHDRDVAAVRAALGDAAFEAAWEAGRRMTVPTALKIAEVHLIGGEGAE